MFLDIHIDYEGEVDIDKLAHDLTAKGVIAPGALTDEQAEELNGALDRRLGVRTLLEAYAKGER